MTALLSPPRSRSTDPLTQAQQDLAGDPEALKLAEKIARRFARRCPGKLEDFQSAASYGLVMAARRYDPSKGAFFAYAAYRIEGAIRNAIRDSGPSGFRKDWSSAPKTLSLDTPDETGRTMAASITYQDQPEDDMHHQTNGTLNGHAHTPTLPRNHASEPMPKGVRFDLKSQKFEARISRAGERVSLGFFVTKGEAADAYQAAIARSYVERNDRPRAKPGPKPGTRKGGKPGRKPKATVTIIDTVPDRSPDQFVEPNKMMIKHTPDPVVPPAPSSSILDELRQLETFLGWIASLEPAARSRTLAYLDASLGRST